MRKRIQPWPWYVQYRQYSQSGKASRPRIMDDSGKPVSFNKPAQAALAAMAPMLLDRLEKLTDRAEMMHLMVQSAHGFNSPEPQALVEAKELVRVAQAALR